MERSLQHSGRVRSGFFGALIIALLTTLASSCATTGEQSEVSREERARMWLDVANAALLERDPTGTLQSLAKAEEEGVDLAEIHHTRALAFLMKKDLDTAITEARKAVKLSPTYSDANNTLGKLLIDKGALNEAVAPLNAATKDHLYRGAFKAFTNLGIIHYRQGKYELARKEFNNAINASPIESCIARYYRGHVNLRDAKMKEALQDYEEATRKLCADFAEAHLALGIAYVRNGHFERARRKFVEIQQRYPNSALAEQALARLRELP